MVSPRLHVNSGPQILSRVCVDVDELVVVLRLKRPDAHVDPLSLAPLQIHLDQADFGNLNLFFAETTGPVNFTAATLKQKGSKL